MQLIFLVQTLDETSTSVPQATMPTQTLTVAYTISIYTLSQMKKPVKKRGDARSFSLKLESSLEWDAFKAKVLAKIDSVVKPAILSFDDYTVRFTVP